jgi:hypothetical protein
MNYNYFKKSLILSGLLFCGLNVNAQVTTFDYTGSVQTYTVPVGVTSIQIEAWGAEGGTADNDAGSCTIGGLGGYAVGNLSVTPGEVLNVYVGGKGYSGNVGGWNGGGESCSFTTTCSKGGGASDVRQGGTTFSERVIVAGGGGGSEWSGCSGQAGDGGGLEGLGGAHPSPGGVNGGGGTQVAGGAAGVASYSGLPGVFGIGGDAGAHPAGHSGSGGGGWYGGGGSAEDGHAGGGSSYIDGVTDGSTTTGIRTGDGQVIITVLCEPLTVTVSSEEICLGDSFTLDASGDGAITWDGGVINGEPFTPASAGTVTYTATSDDPGDCGFSVDIAVLESPELSYVLTDEVFGGDGEINLTVIGGEPGYLFDWDNDGTGDFDDTEDLTGLVGGTYVVVVQDDAGCSGMETITLNSQVGVYENEQLIFSVYPNPTADQFSIESEGSFTYQIVDVNGALVLNGVGTNLVQVSLSNYAKGSYFVKLNINGNEHVLQLVKQ